MKIKMPGKSSAEFRWADDEIQLLIGSHAKLKKLKKITRGLTGN